MTWPAFPRYPDPLRTWARLAPSRPALIDRSTGARLTYSDLNESVGRWASALASQGLKKSDRVAVIAGNRREVIELFFACGRIGASLVPLNWRLAPVELAGILRHADPALVIGEEKFRSSLNSPSPWADIDDLARRALAGPPTTAADVEAAADDPVLILYTSGSTGSPKGVVIPHRQIFYNAVATVTSWELGPEDIAPIATPFFHTGGWNVFATPLWHRGGTVVLFDRFDPDDFLKGIAEEKCTVVLTVPTQLVMMRNCESWGIELPHLRFFISGGAPCPASLLEEIRGKGYRVKTGYGLTECGPNCFAISEAESLKREGSVGWPISFLEMSLRNKTGAECDVEEPGELLLRGPQMFGGYLHEAERTAEVMEDGWLKTGDFARRDSSGAFYICGRKKDMFISGGENVFPAEVEAAMGAHPAVSEVVVIGVNDELWGEVGRAHVILRPGAAQLSETQLLDFARTLLAKYKVPKSVVFMQDFPRLGSGKADRRSLAANANSQTVTT